jgi:hypothetical protein
VRDRIRAHAPILITAVLVAALTTGGPALATAAFDAMNAHKVDGKHAVGAKASPSRRAGKLVATGASGYLPNGIIKKARDADRLDGKDSNSYLVAGNGLRVEQSQAVDTCTGATLVSYPVRVNERARIFATAASLFSGPGEPSIQLLLRDGGGTLVATSHRPVGPDALGVSQLLLTPAADGGTPYIASPGDYSLQVRATTFGGCSGTGSYYDATLTHMTLNARR